MHPGELWQEYDFNGLRLGSIDSSSYQNPNSKLFGGVAVMLYRFRNGDVEFLFQHRSKFVDRNAEKWDVSAAGHINYKEPKLDSIVREAQEEIGAKLQREKLEFAGAYVRAHRSLVNLYFYDWTNHEDSFHFDDEEVSEVKWVAFKDLVNFWPSLKPQVQDDPIFQTFVLDWTRFVREKYGYLDK